MADEVWLPVVGFEGYYEVSNLGRVRRDARARDWRSRGVVLEEYADISQGLRVINEARRQYTQLVADGYEPDHVLVSTRHRADLVLALFVCHGSTREPYWMWITEHCAIQTVFSPDLPDVYVPTSESADRTYATRAR